MVLGLSAAGPTLAPGRAGRRSGRRTLPATAKVVALLLATALAVCAGTLTAHADDDGDGDQVRHLAVDVVIEASGDVLVTETYHWDFGDREGRGFARELTTLVSHPAGYREYRYTDVDASSPSGAPADLLLIDHGAALEIQVAAPEESEVRVSGVQTYVLSYRIIGALNQIRDEPGAPDGEELYWNITGDSHVPMDEVEVTVTGPVPAERVRCTQSADDTPCDQISPPGAVVTTTTIGLPADTDLTLAVGYPLGTFAGTDPILVSQESYDERFGGDGLSSGSVLLAVGSVFVLGGGGLVVAGTTLRRRRRDLAFVGFPPGVIPPVGAHPPVETVTVQPAVAVRFTPPDDLQVGEVGAIHTRSLRSRDVTATLIDLAVRGYLRIDEVPRTNAKTARDWVLVATPPARTDDLLDYESTLLQALFRDRSAVWLSSLTNEFATHLGVVLTQIGTQIRARGLTTQPLGREGSTIPSFKQRTALGRAYYEQSRGFEKYLRVAEANQLRFEEGQDLFSRYLPYAIAYDLADRWASIFADLEARGLATQRPDWYSSSSPDAFTYLAFASVITQFSQTSSSVLASTPGSETTGSSGGSGFSSSGSFSGGGGGGGGSSGL